MITTKRVPLKFLIGLIKFDLIGVLFIVAIAELFVLVFNEKIPTMPWNVPALLGTAISILLSFKMAQSYDRWWEARKIWGTIVNDSRNLIVNAKLYVQSNEIIRQLAEIQILWCFYLADSLKKQQENHDELTAPIIQRIKMNKVNHFPLSLNDYQISILRYEKTENRISEMGLFQITQTINQLIDSMGKAERIKKTVFPSGYRYILHLSIYVFLVMLSISMKDIELQFHIPLIFILACIFFMLEKSAFNLQDPFDNHVTDVPVYTISKTIALNIKELVKECELQYDMTFEYEFYRV